MWINKIVENESELIEGKFEFLKQRITNLEKERDLAANQKINKQSLRRILFEYVKIYPDLTLDEKSKFNQLLFQEITSNFNKNEEDGILIIKLRGDAKLENSWKVRTSGRVSFAHPAAAGESASRLYQDNRRMLNFNFS